jgi:putative transposase
VSETLDAGLLDPVMEKVGSGDLALPGQGGLVSDLIKACLERGLAVEHTEHLGYAKGNTAGRGGGNSRNGTSPKTVASEVADIDLDVPQDRAGTFEPALVPKGSRREGV